MNNIPSSFVHTLTNSISAVRKKRYDLVIISGNRVLSDLVIIGDSLQSDSRSFLSFSGFLLRVIGIDLYNLSQNSRDTAKLKQRAVTSITKMREILSSSESLSFFKAMNQYEEYVETWANEINENDLAEYSREGELDNIVFHWALNALNGVSVKQVLTNGHPISAIDNELLRMSYMEKLSVQTLVLSICIRSLGWFSETINQVLDMFRKSSVDKDLLMALSSELPNELLGFSKRITSEFDGWKDLTTDMPNEELFRKLLTLNSEILLSWRKLLNIYYQFQIGSPQPPKTKSNEETEEEGEKND